MESIVLLGHVAGGCGRFRDEIGLPSDLLTDNLWLPGFVQGTLNIRLKTSELPGFLDERGLPALDLNVGFAPAVYRSGADVRDNTIRPTAENPKKGDLQLWRAELSNVDTGTKHKCFLIRRVGSGYKDVAELLGERNFRDDHGFKNCQSVTVTVHAGSTG